MYKGFSLIELLIVLLIVGILSLISYPGYREYLIRAHRNEGQTALLDLANRMERYYLDHKTYKTATIGTGTSSDLLSTIATNNHWYNLSIHLATNATYQLIATPAKEQAKDLLCQTLTLNNYGSKGISVGPAGIPTGTARECW